MDSAPTNGAGRALHDSDSCTFPSCHGARVTESGMCDVHRLVVVSSTGSWLEAG